MFLFLRLSIAQAGLFGNDAEEPASVEVAVEAPPPPTAAPLFEGGLPIDLEEIPTGLANITAQGCNACHYQAHDDWALSGHAGTGQNQAFQDALNRVSNSTACSQCHLPLKVQHATLAAGYIDGDMTRPSMAHNPVWDPTLMAEGVGCAACHVRDGKVVGTRPISGAPHPVIASAELGTSEMCATCHQLSFPESDRPFYDTYGEWSRTPYAAANVRCQDCHMPPKAGAATATRFAASPSHAFQADIARALTVVVRLDSHQVERGQAFPVTVTLQNTGAGHHIPTGSPYKSYIVSVSLVDSKGKALTKAYTETLGRTVSSEPPYTTSTDNRIQAGGEHQIKTNFTVDHRKKAGNIHLEVRVGRDSNGPALQSIPLQLY